MKTYQTKFLEFAIQKEVLKFGDFTLKSGRQSPYFFNAGLFNDGNSLLHLGRFYAQAILDSDIQFDMLFGPAYKGIPLVAAISIAFADQHNMNIPFAFNRKEIKDHGEGGQLVGAPLSGKILIVDDVISAGTSVRESVNIINHENAIPAGVSIALDRQEKGTGELSAISEIKNKFDMPTCSIAKLSELIEFLTTQNNMNNVVNSIQQYIKQYGAV
ncbi:MAG: orotate phosphoribosyltransferase [Methylococcales bacterium]|jgi:orotate phosphoribosyltransferase|nr:orotate phosphoribosyltransferase [Methylococcales bacterium]MBT7410085.1 orotate phosphoribosyltransferase [Methylococcales bacterium]